MSVELLAPAGNKESFYAALSSGANAIYLGVETLNARRLAQNIKQSELAELTRLAHLFDCKVYLTVNTLILHDEYAQAIELIADAWKDGIDAIIVQDFGLLSELRTHMPRVRIHASTQMNVHSSDTLRTLAKLGVARVTLSRELSLSQIEVLAAVGREMGIEVEVFGHGALCVSYSGQCLFSSLVGRRSANRGLCAQPCRLSYELINHRGEVFETEGPYLLSPKDLSTIDYLQSLQNAGVASLKIEGRMKKPSYVAAVVSAYRTALDTLPADESAVLTRNFTLGAEIPDQVRDDSSSTEILGRARSDSDEAHMSSSTSPRLPSRGLTPENDTQLTDAFYRALSPGYLKPQQGGDFMDYLRIKNPTTADTQSVLVKCAEDAVAYARDFIQVLDFSVQIIVGEPLIVEVSDDKGNTGHFQGSLVEAARTKPLTAEDVKTHLGRLGNTPYSMGKVDLQLDPNAGMGFSVLHKARRAAIADYEAKRFFGGQETVQSSCSDHSVIPGSDPGSLHLNRTSALAQLDSTAQSRVEASVNVAKKYALQANNNFVQRKVKRNLNPSIVAVVSSLSAAKAVLNAGANEAHINAWMLTDVEPSEDFLVPVLPRVAADSELDTYYGIAERFGRAVCSTLGQLDTCLQRGIPAQVHWSLNVMNPFTVQALLADYAPTRIWLSPELSGRQITSIAKRSTVPLGTALFGQQEVIIAEACVLQGLRDDANPCTQNCPTCVRRKHHLALRDKKGYSFPVTVDPFGRSHMYNSIPLDLSSALPELLDSGADALRLDLETALNTQAAKEVARARRNLIAVAGDTEIELPRRPETVTKGHFFRGVV